MPELRVVKRGNNLAVRISNIREEQTRMQEGDSNLIEVLEGHVELRPAERIPTLEGLVAQITPEERYEEVATGPERGKEIVERITIPRVPPL